MVRKTKRTLASLALTIGIILGGTAVMPNRRPESATRPVPTAAA